MARAMALRRRPVRSRRRHRRRRHGRREPRARAGAAPACRRAAHRGRRAGVAVRNPASTIAPPRSAMPAGASSRAWVSGRRIAPHAAAIRTIHVSDAGRFGFARLTRRGAGHRCVRLRRRQPRHRRGAVGALASLPNGLRCACRRRARRSARSRPRACDSTVVSAAARTSRVDGAPGRCGRRRAFQRACRGRHRRRCRGLRSGRDRCECRRRSAPRRDGLRAVHRLRPLAVLPLHDGSYGVVWTAQPDARAALLALGRSRFLRELQSRFGWRAGRSCASAAAPPIR